MRARGKCISIGRPDVLMRTAAAGGQGINSGLAVSSAVCVLCVSNGAVAKEQ